MSDSPEDILKEFHWLMDILQNIDAGIVVLDMDYNIKLWNSFMQNHSALQPQNALEHNIFEVFPELPSNWFKRKLSSVCILQTAAFTTWEERPFLFQFKNYRPVTGRAEYMYQNCTILPIKSPTGEVTQICLILYDVTEVAVNKLQSQAANEKLRQLSQTDGLTGLQNRKTWEMNLEQEFNRFQRFDSPSSLIMFDIDHFKKINDNFGHPAGDEVIRCTSATIFECVRAIDIAGRYGGEEFAVILVETDAKGAKLVAERIRKAIEALSIIHQGQEIKFTVSLGVSQLNTKIKTYTDWIGLADKGLYQAKEGGRNRSILI